MSLVVVGINHRTAPVEVRERVVFEPARIPEALQQLRNLPDVHETVIVSTCNRTELYCVTENLGQAELGEWLQRYHGLGAPLHHSLYHHDEDRAVTHAFSVASGLDSMVLGEPQILGQMKHAARLAEEAGTLGTTLGKLFQNTFAVAKEVRSTTAIGANVVSMAAAAVHLSGRIFDRISGQKVLFIGAGEMIELCLAHFAGHKPAHIAIANRTPARAEALANKYQATAIAAR